MILTPAASFVWNPEDDEDDSDDPLARLLSPESAPRVDPNDPAFIPLQDPNYTKEYRESRFLDPRGDEVPDAEFESWDQKRPALETAWLPADMSTAPVGSCRFYMCVMMGIGQAHPRYNPRVDPSRHR